MAISIQIHRGPSMGRIPRSLLTLAVEMIAEDYGWEDGQISLAMVDDREIHRVNRQFLNHDYPTDVISFDTTESEEFLEGEIVVSIDTARRVAEEHGWNPNHELLLYIVHGMLHIIGLRDKSPKDIRAMREAERFYMEKLVGDSHVGG
jgi:probable rRNA maturation factor